MKLGLKHQRPQVFENDLSKKIFCLMTFDILYVAVRMLLGHAFNPTPPTVFTVNRPFVFSLATPTNVLFVGRYTV